MRYGLAVVIGVFLLIIGSVVAISRINNMGNNTTKVASRTTKLADYANSDTSSVSWTMQGKLVGDDQFTSLRITITKDKRTAEVLSGYAGRVEKKVELPNSYESYATFTRALDNLGFGRERTVSNADERGVCPQGNRYIYRLTDGRQEVMRTWSASCSNKLGPFAGQTPQVIRTLFTQQITDYNQFIRGVKFN